MIDNTYILERYRPTKLEDFVGQENEIKKAQEWMDLFKQKKLYFQKKYLIF